MKLEVILAFGLGACAAPQPLAPVVPSNSCPAPEVSCKAAVEKAGAATKTRERDITMAIGECEQHGWSIEARKCVAAAPTNTELARCGRTFNLGTRGLFADANSAEHAFAAMSKFRDQMCACTDTACAQKVAEDMTKWGQEESKDDREPPKMSDEEVKRFTQLGEDMGHCMQKAMGGGTP
jgi:hypothetical protein